MLISSEMMLISKVYIIRMVNKKEVTTHIIITTHYKPITQLL